MLREFFRILPEEDKAKQRKLFEGMNVEKLHPELFCGDHAPFGNHPVIYLDMKEVIGSSWKAIQMRFRQLTIDLYRGHQYLEDSLSASEKEEFRKLCSMDPVDESLLGECVKRLAAYLCRFHGRQCVLLIDEYDKPLEHAHKLDEEHMNKEGQTLYTQAKDFFETVYSGLIKGNEDVYKAMLVGVVRVSKADMLSGINNLWVYPMFKSKYSDKFGFTEDEVKALLLPRWPDLLKTPNFNEIKQQYNGYETEGTAELYNPWAIIKLCAEGKIEDFWAETASRATARSLLKVISEDAKDQMGELLAGERVSLDVEPTLGYDDEDISNDTFLWTYLYFAGYLTSRNFKEFKIPNKEVRTEWLRWIFDERKSEDQAKWLGDLLLSGQMEEFKKMLERGIECHYAIRDYQNTDSRDYPLEQVYKGHIVGMLWEVLKARGYNLVSEQPAGLGITDAMIFPLSYVKGCRRGFIFEVKVARKKNSQAESPENLAKIALEQIKEKKCHTRFLDVDEIVYVAIGCRGKEVCVLYHRD
eukprot:CAMPEP_0184671700 /NCGR_PEP_ID=MMETSP0308-20130426/85658_1 /TAXON_ID=38269 /ORGANISM="Gloeochaete witrockiana, Strain SAG 46.84" /LENGTH=526 /DNA_ID=CAMNT_0027118879 /DNA_START=940 /DNA_END=2520 /DNA_ORIENTATION=-